MAIDRSRSKLRGRQPKLSTKQQHEVRRMHEAGDHSISDLSDLFSVSRPTIYRTLAKSATDGPGQPLARQRPPNLPTGSSARNAGVASRYFPVVYGALSETRTQRSIPDAGLSYLPGERSRRGLRLTGVRPFSVSRSA